MERRGKGLIPFEADEKEVTERAKRLIDEWSKEPNRLNKKRLGVLKELFAQKRIADEAGANRVEVAHFVVETRSECF